MAGWLSGGVILGVATMLALWGWVPGAGWLIGLAAAAWLLTVFLLRPSTTCVLVIACLARIVFMFSDAHSDDVYRYVWEGRLQLNGISPFATAPLDPSLTHLRAESFESISHPHLPTIYPPLAQATFAASAAMGLGEVGLKNLFLLIDLAVVCLIVTWLVRTGRKSAFATTYAWSPVAIGSGAMGHVDCWMLLFLVLWLVTLKPSSIRWSGFWLGLAILAKITPVVLLPWMIVRHPRVVLFVTLPVVFLGYAPYLAAGEVLGSLATFANDFAFNSSLFRIVDWALPAALVRPTLAILLIVFLGILSYAEPRPAHAAMLAFTGLLLLSPTVHIWYLTWFLVTLPAVAPHRHCVPIVAWGATGLLALPTYIASRAGGPFHEHVALTVLQYAIPVALGLRLLWRHAPRRIPLTVPRSSNPGSFSVVIPALRERESLARILPLWMETDAIEVVVADTPTGDGTEELVRQFPRARYVAVTTRGYGEAVAAGWRAAAPSDFLVVCDADHPAAPRHVERLIAPLDDADVALVCGARAGRELGLAQRLGNALATGLIGWFWGRRFHDLGPYRAIRRSALAVDAVRDRGFGWNVEMNVRAIELGLQIVEVPMPAAEREVGLNRISGTWRGIAGAGRGILGRIRSLREEACLRPL